MKCKEIKWKIKRQTHLENLYLLQNQLLGLQVVSGQNDDLLHCPLVCGPQHTPVSYTPASSHSSPAHSPSDSYFIPSAASNKG